MIDIDPVLLSAIISDIYDTAYNPASWSVALEKVRRLLRGSKVCVGRIGPDVGTNDAMTTAPDTRFQQLYVDEHHGHPNVLADAVLMAPLGQVYRDHELVGGNRLKRSRFWNDWMAPQDMYGGVGVKVLEDDTSFWIFDIQRGRRQASFDERDVSLTRILAPHVTRALQISRDFQAMHGIASTFQSVGFGIVLVDVDMRILAANSIAETMLSGAGSNLVRMSGRLFAADNASMARLRAMVANVCAPAGDVVPGLGGDLIIRSSNELQANLAVSVTALPGISEGLPLVGKRAAVFLKQTGGSLPANLRAHVQACFGLSPREAELAVALASGLKLRMAAENAGIKFSTARAYLEKVFLKTGTHQQSQLVALLRSVV